MGRIERAGNPVCRVAFPGAPESVWQGLFGGAIVIQSDEIYAITSDGKRHAL